MDEQEDVLEQIVRFGSVSQDSVCNSTYDTCVAAKQQ